MRRSHSMGLIALAAATAMLGLSPAATALPTSVPTTSCSTVYWGSLPKVQALSTSSAVVNVRTGRHECYDRLVVDLKSKPAGYTVKYVDQLRGIGSGKIVPTTGGANLQIVVNAPTSTSYNPGATVKNLYYTTFKQQVWLGSFEGQTMLGISTRARLPMRVFLLDGPGTGSRLVIDVAHRW